MMLCKLVQNTYNSFTAVIFDDAIGNAVEAVHSLLFVCGVDYQCLPKYLKSSVQRHGYFKQAGCDFANNKLRDVHAQELLARGEGESLT